MLQLSQMKMMQILSNLTTGSTKSHAWLLEVLFALLLLLSPAKRVM